jgi:fatty acid desaturase
VRRTNKNIWRVNEITAAYALIYLGFLSLMAALFVSTSWPVRLLIWLMLVTMVGIALTIVKLHADTALYHCPRCANRVKISSVTDLLSPHILDRKLLKCRNCGRRVWAYEVTDLDRSHHG